MSGEYARAWVDAPASGDPSFWGGSIVLSYVLTGERRPYDKKVAYARRILPQRAIGAFEVVGRYSHVDVADALLDGGIFDRGTIGINWWATRRWKVGFDYGLINLDRAGLHGVTHAFRTRFQWVYDCRRSLLSRRPVDEHASGSRHTVIGHQLSWQRGEIPVF